MKTNQQTNPIMTYLGFQFLHQIALYDLWILLSQKLSDLRKTPLPRCQNYPMGNLHLRHNSSFQVYILYGPLIKIYHQIAGLGILF